MDDQTISFNEEGVNIEIAVGGIISIHLKHDQLNA